MENPKHSQADKNNRANQLNANNDAYWSSRGWDNDDDDYYRNRQEDYDDESFYRENYSSEGYDSSDY